MNATYPDSNNGDGKLIVLTTCVYPYQEVKEGNVDVLLSKLEKKVSELACSFLKFTALPCRIECRHWN